MKSNRQFLLNHYVSRGGKFILTDESHQSVSLSILLFFDPHQLSLSTFLALLTGISKHLPKEWFETNSLKTRPISVHFSLLVTENPFSMTSDSQVPIPKQLRGGNSIEKSFCVKLLESLGDCSPKFNCQEICSHLIFEIYSLHLFQSQTLQSHLLKQSFKRIIEVNQPDLIIVPQIK